jgi:hypothetical protein
LEARASGSLGPERRARRAAMAAMLVATTNAMVIHPALWGTSSKPTPSTNIAEDERAISIAATSDASV